MVPAMVSQRVVGDSFNYLNRDELAYGIYGFASSISQLLLYLLPFQAQKTSALQVLS